MRVNTQLMCAGSHAWWAVWIVIIMSVILGGGIAPAVTGLLVLAAWICAIDNFRKREARASAPLAPWILAAAFAAWTAIAFAVSSTKNFGLDDALQAFSYFVIFSFAAREASGSLCGIFRERFSAVIIAMAIATLTIGLPVYILQPYDRFVGTFFDVRSPYSFFPNAFAGFLLLAWPIIAACAKERLAARPVSGGAIVGGVLAGLLLSFSRAAFLAFAAQLILWRLLRRTSAGQAPKKLQPKRSTVMFLLSAVAATILLVAGANAARGWNFPVQSFLARAAFDTPGQGIATVTERLAFFGQALRIAGERPIFGFGPVSFRDVHHRFLQEHTPTSFAHSIFLTFAAERGWMAAILFCLLLGFVLLRAVRRACSNGQTGRVSAGKSSPLDRAALVAVAGLLIHQAVNDDFRFIGVALPFWLLFGMLAADERSATERRARLRGAVELAAMTACVLVAAFEAPNILNGWRGAGAEAAGNTERAITLYEMASDSWFSRDVFLRLARLQREADRLEDASVSLDRFAAVNRENYRLWQERGRIALRSGDFPRAIASYDEALAHGGMADLSIVREELDILHLLGDADGVALRRETFDRIMQAFARAIAENGWLRDTALSSQAGHFAVIANIMEQFFSADAERYRRMATEATAYSQHYRQERERLRGTGFLW
ncbi:hypothetical protein A3H22_03250 [Candidatus Peribacteria bacterium RIFCSPLOWO2_12_FULL_55_15]|nr:MAG: hypothetical protein A2789_01695 [Candidatus Peribacteria bacterium RIFCSPHIGHO2_01_FULL_54_22]OGJ68802.1 MAG: hypothetical protein A3H90_03075 [Candidatus Peribacteria bacterium RIFCSPLOWO2_02_FULL_55_36]OGJ69009.1 MAG: hypothetical protein A2947_01720 [Candidatus Peribacteria bacterium RIFCSPLOWO2_01_FULL_54_110]OGJ70254.1 MAG: hypothetical protein A3H22_03250 [Candidatus Peribacteria bacterium RIFCSPLOWO2_12_FULL_55_15]